MMAESVRSIRGPRLASVNPEFLKISRSLLENPRSEPNITQKEEPFFTLSEKFDVAS